MRFSPYYFLLTVMLFLAEVLIALFVHDQFVRPYLGDVLVVILIYCFLKSFIRITDTKATVFVLLFAFTIEIMQYFNLVEILGWQESKVAKTVLGNYFSWGDLVCYSVGCAIILMIEKFRNKNN